MKILIVDDSKAIRLRLSLVIQKITRHEIIQAPTGEEALSLLTSEKPPEIALVDWQLSDLSAVELCATCERHYASAGFGQLRPYLITMAAQDSADDVLTGLNAGADDYLIKPADDTLLMARLRVAERNVLLQTGLRQHIQNMERTLRRYEILRSVISADTPDKGAATRDTKALEKNPRFSTRIASLSAIAFLHRTITRAFGKLNSGTVHCEESPTHSLMPQQRSVPDYVAWAGTVLDDRDTWLDLIVEMSHAAARRLHQRLSTAGKVDSEEIRDAIAVMIQIVHREFEAQLREDQVESSMHLEPVVFAMDSATKPQARGQRLHRCRVSIGDNIRLSATLCEIHSRVIDRSAEDICNYEVVAAPFRSPDRSVILQPGTVMNSKHIESLRQLEGAGDQPLMIKVIIPSAVGLLGLATG